MTQNATVVRHRSPSGNRDADHFRAECSEHPEWSPAFHSNRTVEGRTLAQRDAEAHNRARHSEKEA